MARFPEAEARMFHGKFVCRKCKTVMRSSGMLVARAALVCRNCGGRAFRVKRRK